ncbi:MAG: alpha-amylase, partial [Prevotella sp.]|nr:alpha-amylase [Prevotella sp.]
RSTSNTLLLVLANFDSQSASVRINLPTHAFDYLNIPEGPRTATELLTGEKTLLNLAKDGAIAASASANGVSIYKITF